jgi:3-oxoadipate enol-lactonase
MPVTDVNGAPLGYDDEGVDTGLLPVVMLHAGIADRRMWQPLATALADRYRVVRYDLRGYGESTPPLSSFAHHDDVVAVLDRLGLDRAALVGCSFGGSVAVDAALAHPDRVAALALFGAVVSGYQWSELNDVWDRVVGDIDEDDLDAVAAGEVRLWVVGPDRQPEDVDAGLLAFAEEMNRRALAGEDSLSRVDVRGLDPPALGRLAEVAVPTLVTAGAADIAEVRRLADRIAAEVPGGRRLPDVPGAAHLLPLERPEPVAAALAGFLAEPGR